MPRTRCLLALAAFVATTTLGLTASADEERTADADAPQAEHAERRVPYALSFNPGAFFIGHYGGQVEYSPMPHHALVVSLAYVSASTSDSPRSTTPNIKGFASEVGWRLYSGSSGPVGAFFGPSLVGGIYVDPATNQSESKPFTILGGALDAGFQARLGSWVLLGAGLGVQTNTVSVQHRDSLDGKAVYTTHDGILPRALLSLGGNFDVK
jgi:hypothetical protein